MANERDRNRKDLDTEDESFGGERRPGESGERVGGRSEEDIRGTADDLDDDDEFDDINDDLDEDEEEGEGSSR